MIGLWQEAFGDTKEEIEEFFGFCEERIRICVWEEESRIVAQLVLIPVTIVWGRAYAAEYIYAVAVKKQFKGCGFATKLLEETRKLLRKESKAGILVPAEETLIGFYQKRGFVTCFLEEKIAMTLPSKGNVTMDMTDVSNTGKTMDYKEITTERYLELRRSAFGNKGFVDLPLQVLSYAVTAVWKEGGKCVQVTYRNKAYGLLYRQTGTEIHVFEITAQTSEEARAVAKLLLAAFASKGASDIFVRRSYLTMGVHLPKGLQETGLFNLVLD